MVKTVKKWLDDLISGCVRTSTCSKCDETFKTKQTIFNFFSYEEVHLLKVHRHFKEFHKKDFQRKEFVKTYLKMILLTVFTWIFFIVCIPLVVMIHFVTFPFWWIHEKTYL